MRVLSLLILGTAICLGQGAEFFEKQIRPVLIQRCYGCHSAASKPVMGGLRVDSLDALKKGGTRGPALVPGDLDHSLLMSAIQQTGTLKMPPAGKIPDAEIAMFAQWIKMGAPWGKDVTISAKTAPFWAFVKPTLPAPPQPNNQKWARNPIDRFVLARLEEKGLTPAPQATRRDLIRRVAFDLTGLPPSPEEVAAFETDKSTDAYARLIDRLLASPRYGERWGRHWLDVARYADTNGLDENLVFLNAWRYRDYVVRAFNQDKPYDQFIREQLAGDLLPKPDSRDSEDEYYQRLTATGFLSLGGKMLAEDDPVKMEMDIIDEQVEATGRAFMGLTIGCARCHDHKFDPIPTADYYSLAGIFKSSKTMENFKVVAVWHEHILAPEADREKIRQHQKRVDEKKKEITAVQRPANEVLQKAARANLAKYLLAAHQLQRFEKHELPAMGSKAAIVKPGVNVWTVDVPAAGSYQIDFRYQSENATPAKLFINDTLVKSNALAKAFLDPSWRAEGIFSLPAGQVKVRLEGAAKGRTVSDIALSRSELAPDEQPKTPEQLAMDLELNSDYIARIADYLSRNEDSPNSVFHEWYKSGHTEADARALQAKFDAANAAWLEHKKTGPYREALYDPNGAFGVIRAPERFYDTATLARYKALDAELKEIEKAEPQFPRAMGVTEGTPTNLKINIRGSHINLGEERPRQFLSAIAGGKQIPIDDKRSGRLELADWIASPDHPLTARVMMNRVWRWHMGSGIVRSVDNFGKLGDAPDNQALLDYLAVKFVESGWSLKAMHRLILMSNTYQMSTAHNARAAEIDPDNRMLWRYPRRRLEAEEIRDSIFSVTGQLDSASGGPCLPSKTKDRQYVNHKELEYSKNRRAVYMPIVRSGLYDVFQTFDYGDPAVVNGDRSTTTVAPQALFMMNGGVVLEQSMKWAQSLLRDYPNETARIDAIWRRAFARTPSGVEKDRALSHLAKARQLLNDDGKAWQSLCRAVIGTNEFIFLD